MEGGRLTLAIVGDGNYCGGLPFDLGFYPDARWLIVFSALSCLIGSMALY